MRKLCKVGAMIIAATFMVAAAAQTVQVQLNGNIVYFPNEQAQYVNGRVLVPLRGVFEQMGATVRWDSYSQTVTARKDGSNIRLKIGDHTAIVNGSPVTIDVPPMIMDGSTMVPIRFVSEALGAQVGWDDAAQLVAIDTTGPQRSTIVSKPQALHRFWLRTNEVIPVRIDQTLSSVYNHRGDTFTATVEARDLHGYSGLPHGTRIEGHITAVEPRMANRPGVIDLSFDRIRFPDGRTRGIDGTLTSLDDGHINKGENGVLMAERYRGEQDNRMVFAGYGSTNGVMVGVMVARPLDESALDSSLGYILGQVGRGERQPTNVTISSGTEMGVRITQGISTSW